MRWFFIQPIQDVLAGLRGLHPAGAHPARTLVRLMLAVVIVWWIYVPIHELLHVAGCLGTGGEVTELQIDPKYGAALLARVLPFVVSGGEYAGRLSGFDTRGSDLIYLATVALPFVLTVVLGVPLLKRAAHAHSVVLFAVGCVLGLAPFISLPGDYYEMGSILVTRGAATLQAIDPQMIPLLRSDDVFQLLSDLVADPQRFAIGGAGSMIATAIVVTASMVGALLLSLGTYHLGGLVSRGFARQPGAVTCVDN